MFLEITHGSEAPQVFPVKDRLLIGSSLPSDIVLPVAGLSRKHVLFLRENDKYYLVDQGSTNGTYVDEERIRPGDRVEISLYLPVRLSRDVVISLVEERAGKTNILTMPGPQRLNEDATSIISLKELSEARTPRGRLSRPSKKASENSGVSQLLNVIIMILFCAVVYLAFRKKS